jgi:asparaginyl-tRNA synthetase
MKYWHVKAELCSGQLEDVMSLVEIFLRDIALAAKDCGMKTTALLGTEYPNFQPPFPRISYRDAIKLLQAQESNISFGQNIFRDSELRLTKHHNGLVWVMLKPRNLEPFLYSICPYDEELTMTANLIALDGFGEICGVAGKSFRKEELDVRLAEKGKDVTSEIYGWVRDSRDFGMVPHSAFGMGFERVIRWFCGTEHFKDVIPFPRVFGREPLP